MSQLKSFHGTQYPRQGIDTPHSSHFARGRFGRLFPTLKPHTPSDEALLELGRTGGVMDPGEDHITTNPNVPAGFVFLGQFIDHDITFDPTSSLERQNDPEALENFRTPLLELDSVYGAGPDASPHLYEERNGLAYFLLDATAPNDLPRNSIGTALIGDPRNDENLIISQMHLAFLKFHNAVLDRVQDFEKAQQLVRWHYQWIVLKEFLPKIVGEDMVKGIFTTDNYTTGRHYYDWRDQPFIPVEFAVAAYRFGHSQVPAKLQVNNVFQIGDSFKIPLFDVNERGDSDPDDLSGFGARSDRRFVDWNYLFDTGQGLHQPSDTINTTLSGPLFTLPFFTGPDDIPSLAQRNLFRGRAFGLPTGQAVACAMRQTPLTPDELDNVRHLGFDHETPLWYYILHEAHIKSDGKQLGPVGGRIVAEVLIGLLEGDRLSFVQANPCWKPLYGATKDDFTMMDLLKMAGVL